jgi:hypothetical protein
MSMKVKPAGSGIGAALLASGAVGLLAVTGCSAGSASSSPGATASATASASSAAPSSTAPSWAAALGTGVTVVPPGSAAPGHGSPATVLAGLFQAVKAKSVTGYCGYAEPSTQAQCKSALSQISASQFPTVKNGVPGYAVIDGDKAVAGLTGTLCAIGQTECIKNSDPAALFTTLHSFSALWKNAMTSNDSIYSLTPLTKVDGKWYVAATS